MAASTNSSPYVRESRDISRQKNRRLKSGLKRPVQYAAGGFHFPGSDTGTRRKRAEMPPETTKTAEAKLCYRGKPWL